MFKFQLKKLWPRKMLLLRNGYSTGFTWVFGLITVFGLGILYIVFNQVFEAHLVPTIKDMVNASFVNIPPATVNEINANIDKYMSFFHVMPYILFFTVIIYMVIAAIRKEREGEFL